ncbi:MAG: hypothetical protein EOP10_25145 [Proteobacteria bacterium]|nr:MAG: hypothetical protein EOP10_25145 [Pseudomonadota bacterium]
MKYASGFLLSAMLISSSGQAADIVGTYALKEVVSQKQRVLPKPLPTLPLVSTSVGFATIRQDGGKLIMTESFCQIDLTPKFPVNPIVPEGLTKAIIVEGELFSETVDGKTVYSRPEAPTPVGVRLEDPLNDPLPTDASDPRIWDEDGDGKLGVTSVIKGLVSGEAYSVRRERYTLQFEATSESTFAGFIVDRSENYILAATNKNLERQLELEQDSDPNKSTVQLVRLSAEMDCQTLLKQKDKLFKK